MEDKFFSIDEVSKYLKIPKSTLYKLSQQGKLPSFKVGKQLRFRKSSLDKWFAEKEERFISRQKPRYILLIDDDQLVLKALCRFLETHGYSVEPAQSGEEALQKLEKARFDLVITDIRMPGMDGIETIERIREFHDRYNKPRVPEIIITGYVDAEANRQAERLGISDYLYKPFATADFIKTVKKKLEFSSDSN